MSLLLEREDELARTTISTTIRGEAYNRGAPIDLCFTSIPPDAGPGVVQMLSAPLPEPMRMTAGAAITSATRRARDARRRG